MIILHLQHFLCMDQYLESLTMTFVAVSWQEEEDLVCDHIPLILLSLTEHDDQ